MARPRKNRCIRRMPASTFYKPRGIALHDMKGVTLPLEGFEALRLVDAEGVSREEAARMMDVSTPTLCRILAEARSIVARALANGWALRIEGGDYTLVDQEHQEPCESPFHCRRRKRR
ncbi:hypothetical protein GF1_07870 [Desulfolithobacter dissulfuricans]|uniref:UPF0251 protein GF1_07870 n=1 Tax=Desulfolithobacter dissulfuricans TaxID=2795293 RepID=A0A915XKL0_9BACT|nr:DUF134 domain-containing protein [Desulfolithobacter dissulfuricans]BCO08411.1 hypothetical protein GF1_07870 [Desulfolithobacter dissulfuricans]